MAMPETAMHKHDLLPRREHDVGAARQIATMEPEAISEPVQRAAQGEFRLRVLLADLRHYVRAALRRYVVSHEGLNFGFEGTRPPHLFEVQTIASSLCNDLRETWQILVVLLKGSDLTLVQVEPKFLDAGPGQLREVR